MRTWTKRLMSVALVTGVLAGMPNALAHGNRYWNHEWQRERIEQMQRYRYPYHRHPGWHRGYWQRGWAGGYYGWWWVAGNHWYLYAGPVYPYPYGSPSVVIQLPPIVIR